MSFMQSFIALVGRCCLAAIFLVSGIGKLINWDMMLAYVGHADIAYPELALAGAALAEIVLGTLLLFGWHRRLTASVLALYLIPVTYFFHNFWEIQDPALWQLQFMHFMKNLAIFGGLLLVASGPGKYMVDKE